VSQITADSRPTLAPKARLRWDRQTSRYLLLYPERGLVLNPTAADVVQLCTGEHTVGDIVDRLAVKYAPQPREEVEREILAFLDRMAERGLIRSGEA
jgi:coenzyme PQQ biosynthesis protein PqqD